MDSPKMSIEEIIWALRTCDDELPVTAVRAAIEHGTAIVPALIEEIHNSALQATKRPVGHDSHRFAVIVLVVIEAIEALPDLLDAFSEESWKDFPIFGTMLEDTLPHVIAQLCIDPADFVPLIRDDDLSLSFRESLIRGLFGMVAENKLSRSDAAKILKKQLNRCEPRSTLAPPLSQALTDLCLPDNAPGNSDQGDDEALPEQFRSLVKKFKENRITDPVESIQRLPRGMEFETPPADLEEALRILETPESPEKLLAAVRWLRKRPEPAIPALMQALDDALEPLDEDNWTASEAPSVAAVLLAEFGHKPALPAILRIACHPDRGVMFKLRQILWTQLGEIVATLANGPDDMRAYADDPGVDEDVRIVLVNSVPWMVVTGSLNRDQAIDYLQDWLKSAITSQDSLLATSIIWELMDLGAKQAAGEIRRAFQEDCCDEAEICEEEVDEWMEEPDTDWERQLTSQQRSLSARHSVFRVGSWLYNHLLEDVDGDDPEDLDDEFDDDYPPGLDLNDPADYLKGLEAVRQMRLGYEKAEDIVPRTDDWLPPPVDTIYRTDEKIGRNDPCPCGSGKKYKKCCLKLE